MHTIIVIASLCAVVVIGYSAHRLMLWMEDRGWVYYRKSGGGGSGVGNALNELNSFFETDARNARNEILEEREEERKAGDAPREEDRLHYPELDEPDELDQPKK
ncbi:MAG: hypothetical protein P9L94_14265 [Candidatus Hinthialibacter antarcticus]|nr:hypothetical protein [Candidatus Hinthialibacter antarcticus]